MASRAGAQKRSRGEVRIIGGRWRGRKLTFSASDGLRPSPDRVRETLFNWLAAEIDGAHCLDLFAGSAALGLEALSRGAASCHFVDSAPVHCRQIQQHLVNLGRQSDPVFCSDAVAFLDSHCGSFDLVFLDPPFGSTLVEDCCRALLANSLLTPGGTIYVESGVEDPMPNLPQSFELHRDKRAGKVNYRLFRHGMG